MFSLVVPESTGKRHWLSDFIKKGIVSKGNRMNIKIKGDYREIREKYIYIKIYIKLNINTKLIYINNIYLIYVKLIYI